MLPPRASMTAWQRRFMLLTSLLKLFWGSSFHSSTTATHSSGRSRGCRAQAWRRLLSWSQPCSSGLRSEDSTGHSMWRSPTSWIRACTILARCGGASSPTKMKFGVYWRCFMMPFVHGLSSTFHSKVLFLKMCPVTFLFICLAWIFPRKAQMCCKIGMWLHCPFGQVRNGQMLVYFPLGANFVKLFDNLVCIWHEASQGWYWWIDKRCICLNRSKCQFLSFEGL